MVQVHPRSILKGALLCAGIVVVLLLANPIGENAWMTGEELDFTTTGGDDIRWAGAVIALGAPIAGGLLAGVSIGREKRKHYEPLMDGGIATATGLLLGVVLWGVTGGVVHGAEEAFASFAFGLMFAVIGVGVGFLVGGLTARQLAW